MAFNDSRGHAGRRPAAAAAIAVFALALAPQAAAAELTARQAEALARVRGARELLGSAAGQIWPDLEIRTIPVLFVEARPGRAPFALLVVQSKLPEGFEEIGAGAAEGRPPVGRAASFRADAPSPVALGGSLTALYRRGDPLWPTTVGEPSAEMEILAIVHQIVHAHLAAKGGDRFTHRGGAPPLAGAPAEVTALSAMESLILAEILFTAPSKRGYLEQLARQLVATRFARESLTGDGGAAFAAAELSEAAAIWTEYEILRRLAASQLVAPASVPEESAYSAFKYGLILRLNLIFGPLLQGPVDPVQVAARAPMTGAAVGVVLDRLQIPWLDRLAAGTPPGKILEEALPMDPPAREEALRQARSVFNFEAILAVAREQAATASGPR